MKISQPIASCVAHAGKVCHLCSNGSIDGAGAPYGSWLQVETRHDARKKAKRRRFGFNADEELNLSDDDSNAQQPFAATTPNCPGNKSGPINGILPNPRPLRFRHALIWRRQIWKIPLRPWKL